MNNFIGVNTRKIRIYILCMCACTYSCMCMCVYVRCAGFSYIPQAFKETEQDDFTFLGKKPYQSYLF